MANGITVNQDLDLVTPCEAQPCADDSSKTLAYKQLIIDIADNLSPEDIERLSYQQDVQTEFKDSMKLFRYLERRGRIGQLKLSDLSEMLKAIHREDLVTKMIEPFQRKHSSPSSEPLTILLSFILSICWITRE